MCHDLAQRGGRHALNLISGFTASQKSLVDRVDRLTRERIAPRAAEYDQAGRNPVDSWRDLAREDFLASAVPVAHGGLGLDMATYIAVIRTIARGCASTAMTLHMHSTVLRFIDALGTEAQKRRYFGDVVSQGKLVGSWGSEPAVSLSRTLLMETVIREADDGYVIDGIKHFCTMALGASHYMVWCALDGGTDMSKSLMLALVPADASGIATDGKWNTLGMRATFSPSVTFTGVRVPNDATLGDPGAALRLGIIEGFALGYAAVYLGIGEAAFDYMLEYAKTKTLKPSTEPMSHHPLVQRTVAQVGTALRAARLLVHEAARVRMTGDKAATMLVVNQAKAYAAEVGLDATTRALQMAGGRGILKELPLERWHRDALAGPVMPPSNDRCLETAGKLLCGLRAATLEFQ